MTGIFFVPLRPESKSPLLEGWNRVENLSRVHQEALRLLDAGHNIGVQLGVAAGGLVDTDVDAKSLPAPVRKRYLRWVAEQMPPTGWVWGRNAGEPSHYLYRLGDPENGRHTVLGGGVLELRYAVGDQTKQSMIPPSVHPETGRPLEWVHHEEPETIRWENLFTIARHIAAVGLLASVWTEGTRHQLALPLAGFLARAGWDEEAVLQLVRDVCWIAEDEEVGDREQAVRDTFAKYREQRTITGGPTLASLVGREVFRELCELWGIQKEQLSQSRVPLEAIGTTIHGTAEFVYRVMLAENETTDHPLAYDYQRGTWLVWDGRVWQDTSDEAVGNRAVELVVQETHRLIKQRMDALYEEFQSQPETEKRSAPDWKNDPKLRLLNAIQSDVAYRNAGVKAGLERFRGAQGVIVQSQDFDADHWIINTPTGILDLRTGELKPHDPSYRCRKMTSVGYNPNAQCPEWERFLLRIFQNDHALVEYLQMVCGTGLLGINPQQECYLLYGSGANGKGTFLRTILHVLGSYAGTVQEDAVINKFGHDAKTRALASLEGIRLGVLYDTDISEESSINIGALKTLTENAKVKVRGPYEKPREVFFGMTLFTAINEKPDVKDFSDGAWRRIRLVPFVYTIPPNERDDEFAEKRLFPEAEGILRWAVEGLKKYQQLRQRGETLRHPAVMDETEGWRNETCPARAWLLENLVPDPRGVVSYDAIVEGIANETGEWLRYEQLGRILQRLDRLQGHKIVVKRTLQLMPDGSTKKVRVVVGFRLRTPSDTPTPPDDGAPTPTDSAAAQPDGGGAATTAPGPDGPVGPDKNQLFSLKAPIGEKVENEPVQLVRTGPQPSESAQQPSESAPPALKIPWGRVERSVLLEVAKRQSPEVQARLAQMLAMDSWDPDRFWERIEDPNAFEVAVYTLGLMGTNLWVYERCKEHAPLGPIFWHLIVLMLAEKLGYPEIGEGVNHIARGYKPWTDTVPYAGVQQVRQWCAALIAQKQSEPFRTTDAPPTDEAEQLRQHIRQWMETHEPFGLRVGNTPIPAKLWKHALQHAKLEQLREWAAQLFEQHPHQEESLARQLRIGGL